MTFTEALLPVARWEARSFESFARRGPASAAVDGSPTSRTMSTVAHRRNRIDGASVAVIEEPVKLEFLGRIDFRTPIRHGTCHLNRFFGSVARGRTLTVTEGQRLPNRLHGLGQSITIPVHESHRRANALAAPGRIQGWVWPTR